MKSSFQIIHIIGSVQGLFLVFLLGIREKNKAANKILAALIFMISIHLAISFFHVNRNVSKDLLAFGRSDLFIFVYGPLIYLYTRFLTGLKDQLRIRDFIGFMPSISILMLIALYYTRLEMFKKLWDSKSEVASSIWYVLHLSALLYLLLYMIKGLAVVYRYREGLADYFSQSGRIYLLWLRILLFSITGISILAIVQFMIHSFRESNGILEWLIAIVTDLLVFIMGYFTYYQPDILEDLKDMKVVRQQAGEKNPKDVIPEDTDLEDANPEEAVALSQGNPVKKYERNRLDEELEKKNLKQLLAYVIKNKPYLNSELNLRQLAEETGIPSHQLSMLLSIYLNQNFYSFINGYRIEEAKRLLAEEDGTKFNIIEVAYEAGFNSKTTFNTVFKKSEGLTPSEYRLKNQRKA